MFACAGVHSVTEASRPEQVFVHPPYVDYTEKLEHEGATLHVDNAISFFNYLATHECFIRKALAVGFDCVLLESIEDYVSSERALPVTDVNMSRFQDEQLCRFAAGGYLNVLKKWIGGGMAETPQEIGKLTATYVRRLLGPRRTA